GGGVGASGGAMDGGWGEIDDGGKLCLKKWRPGTGRGPPPRRHARLVAAASRHSPVMKPNACRHRPAIGNWRTMPTASSARFGSAISFVQEVGELAETEGRTPQVVKLVPTPARSTIKP